jgi:predicted nucleic-acid-binding Zn-ribbon protein
MENELKCPKCQSTQLSANKKGFSAGKAAAGAILTGGIGLAAGAIGSNKILITCLNCGHEFKPGGDAVNVQKKKQQEAEMAKNPVFIGVFVVIMLLFFLLFFKACM